MNKLFDAKENIINLQTPAEAGEELDDTNKLRAIRMMNINNELKKIEKSESESFFNYIEREKLNLETDKEKIIASEEFTDYYFVNNFSTIYIEACEGNLEFNSPEILSLIILFDKLFHAQKWKMKRIVDYFTRKNLEMALSNEPYDKTLKEEFNKFYNKNILKKESDIN